MAPPSVPQPSAGSVMTQVVPWPSGDFHPDFSAEFLDQLLRDGEPEARSFSLALWSYKTDRRLPPEMLFGNAGSRCHES